MFPMRNHLSNHRRQHHCAQRRSMLDTRSPKPKTLNLKKWRTNLLI
jgi:hypothetical protein